MFGVDDGSNFGVGVLTLHPSPETTLRLCMRHSEVIMGKGRHGVSAKLRQRWLSVKIYRTFRTVYRSYFHG